MARGGTKLVTTQVSNYAELKEAVTNSTCDIVKLTADIDVKTDAMDAGEYFMFKRKLTLDLNGKTISSTKDVWNDETKVHAILEIGEGGDVTITGNGKVVSNENDAFAVQVSGNGKVTIESGEFVGNIQSVYVLKGSLAISGGKFSIQQLDNVLDPETNLVGYGYVINFFDANYNSSLIEITGGEFENFNPANNIAEGENTNFVKTGYKAVLQENSTATHKVYKVVKEQ